MFISSWTSLLPSFSVSSGNFKFLIERQNRYNPDNYVSQTWEQNKNPYKYSYNSFNNYTISSTDTAIIYDKEEPIVSYIKYFNILDMSFDNSNTMMLMPYDTWRIFERDECSYITKIYVKADDYYNALNNIELEVS